ncbi:LPS assembly protein LptD [Oecophyllibacter saccharovorans]|nr:LPS assembly protein LptD [Oecophyllibacter saccharovorans]
MAVPGKRPSRARKRMKRLSAVLSGSALGVMAGTSWPTLQQAQAGTLIVDHPGTLVKRDHASTAEPLTYLTDHESIDKTGLVVWEGNVRVWQGRQALRADKVTLDRPAGLIRATGHVAFVQDDGSTLYGDHVEFTHGLKDGIGTAIYLRMEKEARMASAGVRRTNGLINDFAHAVYTACPICLKHPDQEPFWEIKAAEAIQDKPNQTLDFDHAWLRLLGLPIFYFPYFSVTDPTVKRHSGFMTFNVNPHDRYLGTYFTLPYFWAIDKSSDLMLTPLISSKTGPELTAEYRKRFNFGALDITGALADDTIKSNRYRNIFGQYSNRESSGAQGYIFAKGNFDIDKHWQAGFNANLATSSNYMRNYRIPGYGNDVLFSNAFIQGFGVGSFLRFDGQASQGLNNGVIRNADLPFALPRFTYDYMGEPDAWGGRFSVHTTDFDVLRSRGASDQRGELRMQWDRPFHNNLGQQWLVTARLDSMVYHSTHLNEQPLYEAGGKHSHVSGQVMPTVAVKMNWPFLRSFAKGHGSQVFEPIVQFIAAPDSGWGARRNMPNEDSLWYEFSDTTMFALNRYLGTDRLDGGVRGNVGIHQNWTWNGRSIDMLIGESFQQHITHSMPAYSGLEHHISDPVGRIRLSPSRYFDATVRGRFNPWRKKFDYGESLFSVGDSHFRLLGGYVYAPITPYYYYYTDFNTHAPNLPYLSPTNELTGGFTANWGHYHLSAYTRRAMSRKQFVANGGDVGYSNDCFGLDLIYMRQYTFIGGQRRHDTVLFNFFFKTIGTIGING